MKTITRRQRDESTVERVLKPNIILVYNKYKHRVDLSDQLSAH